MRILAVDDEREIILNRALGNYSAGTAIDGGDTRVGSYENG